jgi:hypothetical protein
MRVLEKEGIFIPNITIIPIIPIIPTFLAYLHALQHLRKKASNIRAPLYMYFVVLILLIKEKILIVIE